MITMTEIARLTNVSQSTVSRVLNGNPKVDPEIREKVLNCAKENDYQLNVLAQGLQGKKTHLIGVLLSDISNRFFSELAKKIESRARENGYSIILFNSDYDPVKQSEYLDIMRQYRVDGILMVPLVDDKKVWDECKSKLDIPTVMITLPIEGYDSVYLDHKEAGKVVAKHLMSQDYTEYIFIGNDDDLKFQGFKEELEKEDNNFIIKYFDLREDDDFTGILKNELKNNPNRVGIFARNDLRAMQVISTIHSLGYKIPDEIGVIGFDNILIDKYFKPRISSVNQPTDQMVNIAVDRLISRIDDNCIEDILDIPLNAELVPRESSSFK